MTDITTITELVEPFTGIEITAPKVVDKATRSLWVMVIIIIAIFGIWGYIVFRENQNKNRNNTL
ncbi:MAG: hypothetical protein V9F05_13575 [Chitinophagaceae bacterium]